MAQDNNLLFILMIPFFQLAIRPSSQTRRASRYQTDARLLPLDKTSFFSWTKHHPRFKKREDRKHTHTQSHTTTQLHNIRREKRRNVPGKVLGLVQNSAPLGRVAVAPVWEGHLGHFGRAYDFVWKYVGCGPSVFSAKPMVRF